jgi:uncharacterized protein
MTHFLLAPGAGAGQSSPWMQHWKGLLAKLGTVQSFDYPYAARGSKRPDPLPRLIEAHLDELKKARALGHSRIVLIGKSMGSRVGCHVSLLEPVHAVVCLGYPLVGRQGKNLAAKVRDQVLLDSRQPVLFVQGTRDSLCPLDALNAVRSRMTAVNELHVVETGDHSLCVTKTRAKEHLVTQTEVDEQILTSIAEFVAGCRTRA